MINTKKEQVFYQLFEENREKIYRLCYAYLYNKDEIDDLFQEIMMNIWNSLDKFRNESKISTWVYRIAINSAIMHNRKDTKHKDLFSRGINLKMDIEDNLNESYEREEKLVRLRQSILKLKSQDRLIISMVLEGLKYEEISEITGMTLSNVGVRINRIKVFLSNLMKEESNG